MLNAEPNMSSMRELTLEEVEAVSGGAGASYVPCGPTQQCDCGCNKCC